MKYFSARFFLPLVLLLVNVTPSTFAETDATAAATSPLPSSRLLVAPQTLRSNEVTLVWDRADNHGSAVAYQVLQDGRTVSTTAKTYYTARNLAPDHDYQFAVMSLNSTGKKLAESEPVHLHTTSTEKILSVVNFGAKGDGKTINTKAIQAAIDACPSNGIVAIPAGVFISGALFLKSQMTLQILAGGVLQGSTAVEDYEPLIRNRFEGWELETCASLLNAGRLDHNGPANIHHLSIRGEGKLAGGGKPLAEAMIAKHGMRGRGRLICLMNCSNVEIQGLTLETPPSWTLHYIYSENVTCHDLTITTAILNGDGIDPDSSRNSSIFNCTFDTGDDCIAIKSGKNPEGNVINRATEDVHVFDCRFVRGHGISIGSETSGGVRRVLVEDCVAGKLLHGLQIKATPERGNVVEDVTVRDCDLMQITILTALPYNNDGAPAPEQPYFRNFSFQNLDLGKADPTIPVIVLHGFSAPGHRTKNVTFDNVKLPRGALVEVDQAEDVTFRNTLTVDGKPPTFAITRSDRVVH